MGRAVPSKIPETPCSRPSPSAARDSPRVLIADRLRCNPGRLEPSVSYTPTLSFFCASSFWPWRTLGSWTQHAGGRRRQDPPHRHALHSMLLFPNLSAQVV